MLSGLGWVQRCREASAGFRKGWVCSDPHLTPINGVGGRGRKALPWGPVGNPRVDLTPARSEPLGSSSWWSRAGGSSCPRVATREPGVGLWGARPSLPPGRSWEAPRGGQGRHHDGLPAVSEGRCQGALRPPSRRPLPADCVSAESCSRLQSISAVGRVEGLRPQRESRGHPECACACQNRAHFHHVFPRDLQACSVLGKQLSHCRCLVPPIPATLLPLLPPRAEPALVVTSGNPTFFAQGTSDPSADCFHAPCKYSHMFPCAPMGEHALLSSAMRRTRLPCAPVTARTCMRARTPVTARAHTRSRHHTHARTQVDTRAWTRAFSVVLLAPRTRDAQPAGEVSHPLRCSRVPTPTVRKDPVSAAPMEN